MSTRTWAAIGQALVLLLATLILAMAAAGIESLVQEVHNNSADIEKLKHNVKTSARCEPVVIFGRESK